MKILGLIMHFLYGCCQDIVADNRVWILRWAVEWRLLGLIKILSILGIDFRVDGDWALLYAVSYGYLDVVQCLHAVGVDVQTCDNYAIKSAAQLGHLDVVRFLHVVGADIFAVRKVSIKNPELAEYVAIKKWYIFSISHLCRLASEVYVTHYQMLPQRDEVPTSVMDILLAAKA